MTKKNKMTKLQAIITYVLRGGSALTYYTSTLDIEYNKDLSVTDKALLVLDSIKSGHEKFYKINIKSDQIVILNSLPI